MEVTMTLPNLSNPRNSMEPLWTLMDLRKFREDHPELENLSDAVEAMGPRYFTTIEEATVAVKAERRMVEYKNSYIDKLTKDLKRAWELLNGTVQPAKDLESKLAATIEDRDEYKRLWLESRAEHAKYEDKYYDTLAKYEQEHEDCSVMVAENKRYKAENRRLIEALTKVADERDRLQQANCKAMDALIDGDC